MATKKLPWFVAGLSVIAAASYPPAVEAEERPAAITFEYRDGVFSEQFIDWIARHGARTPVKYDPKATVEDYARGQCGAKVGSNVKLFRAALALQNVTVHADGTLELPTKDMVLLPPCLPAPASTPAPRIVLPRETLWDIYGKQFKSVGVDWDSISPVSPLDGFISDAPTNIQEPADLPETQFEIDKITSRYLIKPQNRVGDAGEVAWRAFLAANELKRVGISDDHIKKTVAEKLDTLAPGYSSSDFETGVQAAMRKWSGSNQIASDAWLNLTNGPGPNKDELKEITWFDPNPSVKKNPTKLQPGDIVLVPTTAVQSVEIPVDYASLAAASSVDALKLLRENPPPAPTGDAADNPIDVSLSDTQPFEDMTGDVCASASYKFWDTETFAREFSSAALRTRMLAYRKGVQDFSASIVVVDSGFVFARDAGAFREGLFTQVASLLHQQEASANLGSKRVHGTVVAGLALGGPELWGMTPALGLNIKITPATIFRDRLQNNNLVPVFEPQWLMSAIGGAGDIFNISFATRDESRMRSFEDYVGKSAGKLFIIAAGNNNLNNDVKGADINDTQLYPQRFGGNERGPNVITVAAYDGKGLAKFSNYSESYVSIAAPGCAVTSWAPNDDGSAYVQRQVTGTSFSTPIVAHVAALIKAMMPQQFAEPRYVRARILAGADLVGDLKGVEDGRLLNPIKAISLYEDVVELQTENGRRIVTGQLQAKPTVNDLCQGSGAVDGHSELLKFARDPTPADDKDSVVYLMRDGILDNTKTCRHKPGFLAFMTSAGEQLIINLDDVVDMVLKVPENG